MGGKGWGDKKRSSVVLRQLGVWQTNRDYIPDPGARYQDIGTITSTSESALVVVRVLHKTSLVLGVVSTRPPSAGLVSALDRIGPPSVAPRH